MTTLVGTQNEFHDALYALCELDYDAAEAYKAAINRLENVQYKHRLTEFLHDHERHIQDISSILKKHQQKTPKGPDMKQYLAQGKVALANLLGDTAILKAMITNEEDTNTAYERVNKYADKWEDAASIVAQGLDDERKHRQWLENTIKSLK
jgi:bacterioferritin (cytochrome b1)